MPGDINYPSANENFDYARSPVEVGLSAAVDTARSNYIQRANYIYALRQAEATKKLHDAEGKDRKDNIDISRSHLIETIRHNKAVEDEAKAKLEAGQAKVKNPYAKFGFGDDMDDPKTIKWYADQYRQKKMDARARIPLIRNAQDMQKFLLSTYEVTDPSGQTKRAPISTLFDSEVEGQDILGQPTIRKTKKTYKGAPLPASSGLLGGGTPPVGPSFGAGITGGGWNAPASGGAATSPTDDPSQWYK